MHFFRRGVHDNLAPFKFMSIFTFYHLSSTMQSNKFTCYISNFINQEKCVIFNFFLFIVIFIVILLKFPPKVCVLQQTLENSENDFYFTVKLDDCKAYIHINETTGFISKLQIKSLNAIYNYSLFDSYEITKAFHECIDLDGCHKLRKVSSSSEKECYYFINIYLLKFCFDTNLKFKSALIFNELRLAHNDVLRLKTALELFLRIID